MCNTYSQGKFKATVLKSNLCDYSDAFIPVKGPITITGAGAENAAKQGDKKDKEVVFKNCAPFTDCIIRVNNAQADNGKDLDVVMLMYKLIEYSDNCSKTSGSLWQYYRDEPRETDIATIANSKLFKSKVKILGKTPADGDVKDVEMAVPLKYSHNFWRTFEILINCELISF